MKLLFNLTILFLLLGVSVVTMAGDIKDNDASEGVSVATTVKDNDTSEDVAETTTVDDVKDNDTSKKDEEETKKQLKFFHKEAFTALRNGEYDYSSVMFEKYLELKDDNPKMYEYLSQVYTKLEKRPEAIGALRKVLELNPKYDTAHFLLGKLYREIGYYEDSIEHLKKYLDKKKDVNALFELGLTYERTNKLDQAKEIYKSVILLKANHAEAHFSLGLLLFRELKFDKALESIQRAIDLNPDNPLYGIYYNKVLDQRGQASALPKAPLKSSENDGI